MNEHSRGFFLSNGVWANTALSQTVYECLITGRSYNSYIAWYFICFKSYATEKNKPWWQKRFSVSSKSGTKCLLKWKLGKSVGNAMKADYLRENEISYSTTVSTFNKSLKALKVTDTWRKSWKWKTKSRKRIRKTATFWKWYWPC